MFLFDIVSNKQNSFDLDKLDYLNRDLEHTKINEARLSYRRIIEGAHILDSKICYNQKNMNEINIVFKSRFVDKSKISS